MKQTKKVNKERKNENTKEFWKKWIKIMKNKKMKWKQNERETGK